MYVGLDLHKMYTQYAVMDNDGALVREGRIENDPGELERFSDSLTNANIVIESSSTWYGVYKIFAKKHHVVLSNPGKTKAIASAKVKTDTYVDGQAGSPLLLPAFGSNGVAINLAPLGCEGAGDNPALSPQTHTNARRRNLTILR